MSFLNAGPTSYSTAGNPGAAGARTTPSSMLPPPPPTLANYEVRSAGQSVKNRLRSGSSILTSGQGVLTPPNLGKATLLGGGAS